MIPVSHVTHVATLFFLPLDHPHVLDHWTTPSRRLFRRSLFLTLHEVPCRSAFWIELGELGECQVAPTIPQYPPVSGKSTMGNPWKIHCGVEIRWNSAHFLPSFGAVVPGGCWSRALDRLSHLALDDWQVPKNGSGIAKWIAKWSDVAAVASKYIEQIQASKLDGKFWCLMMKSWEVQRSSSIGCRDESTFPKNVFFGNHIWKNMAVLWFLGVSPHVSTTNFPTKIWGK